MKFLRLIATTGRSAGWGARHDLARLLGYGRDLALALWAIAVLAFCILGLVGALR